MNRVEAIRVLRALSSDLTAEEWALKLGMTEAEVRSLCEGNQLPLKDPPHHERFKQMDTLRRAHGLNWSGLAFEVGIPASTLQAQRDIAQPRAATVRAIEQWLQRRAM